MKYLLNFLIIYIFLTNILSIHISEAYNMESIDGHLNQKTQFIVNITHGFLISYKFPICTINFLQMKIESELKGNEYVSIKNNSETCELRIENKHNRDRVVTTITICSQFQLSGCGKNEKLQIELRTNAERNLAVFILAFMDNNFTINVGESRNEVTIDDYSPKYWFLKFNDTNEDMEVKIKSDDDYCMNAFIEMAECSANLLKPNLESERVKTITKKGTILIKNIDKYIKNSLFLAFKLNDSCNPGPKVSNATFKIKKFDISFLNINTNYFSRFNPFWSLILYYFLAGGIFAVVYHMIWFWEESKCKKCSLNCWHDKNLLCCASCKTDNADEENNCGYFKCWNFENFLPSKYIFIISIFYTLPTVQLLFHYIDAMNVHGNFDLCYYNDQCSKPYGIFLAFNNFLSNFGYGIMGFIFIIIVGIRHSHTFYNKDVSSKKSLVPLNFGIFYALGLSLIMEGLISAIYHICPRPNTIQFDSTFMYIIGCLLNLYYAVQLMSIFETYTSDNTIRVDSKYNIIEFNTSKDTLEIDSKKNTGKENSKILDVTLFLLDNTETRNSQDYPKTININNNTTIINAEKEKKEIISKNYIMTFLSCENKVIINAKRNTRTNRKNVQTNNEGNNTETNNEGNNTETNNEGNNTGINNEDNNTVTNNEGNNTGTHNEGNDTGTNNEGNNTVTNNEGNNNGSHNEGNNTETNNEGNNTGINNEGNNTETNNEGNNTETNNEGNNTETNNEGNNTGTNNEGNNTETNNEGNNTVTNNEENITSITNGDNIIGIHNEDDSIGINNLKNYTVIIDSKDYTVTSDSKYNTKTIISEDNTIIINSKNNTLTVFPKEEAAKSLSTNNIGTPDSENNAESNKSENNIITINSKNDFIKINLEDDVPKMHSKDSSVTEYHNIKIKEMFIYMSIVILMIILILVFEEKLQRWIVWILIAIIQIIVVPIYCSRIFICCTSAIAYPKNCRAVCIAFIILVNVFFFILGCIKFAFYFYFLVTILTNCATLAVEFYVIISVKTYHKYKTTHQSMFSFKIFFFSKIFKFSFIAMNSIFALLFTGFALDSFFQAPTEWTKLPSLSREINQECIWWNFYDIHDKWHFLSSIAIFLIFMIIFLMDSLIYEEEKENEMTTKKKVIKVLFLTLFFGVGISSMVYLFR